MAKKGVGTEWESKKKSKMEKRKRQGCAYCIIVPVL